MSYSTYVYRKQLRDTQATGPERRARHNLLMGTLYLVRHGQASFGADDYDVLSPLGHQQARRLGEHFKTSGIAFDSALTGTLQRQISTHASICEGMGVEMPQASDAERRDGPALASSGSLGGSEVHAVASVGTVMRWPGLNEYDSHAVIATVHAGKLERPTTPEMYRHHFRLLKDGLQQWMDGTASPAGMPTYPEFLRGVTGALDHVRANCTGNVLLVSSGGPIATAVGHVLGCPPQATIELNLRIRNSSVTEFAFNPKRHMLVTYNTLPHLNTPQHADWITYA